MVAMMNQDAPYSGIAGLMAAKGRYGDTELLHVRPDELAGLASVGQLTINPDTGLPEAFSFRSLLPAIGAIAGSVLLGPGIGTALGEGAFAAAAGAGLGAGIGGFTGGLAAGQSPTEALIGGLVSGATSGIMAGIMGPSPGDLTGITEAGAQTAQQTSGQAITKAGLEVGKFASPESLLRPELTATPPINVGQVLSPSGSYIPGSLQSLVSPELTVTPAINAGQVLSPSGSYISGSLPDPTIGSPVPQVQSFPLSPVPANAVAGMSAGEQALVDAAQKSASQGLPPVPVAAPPAASDTVSKLVKVEGDLAKELGSTSIGDSVKAGLNPGEQVVTVGGIKTLPYVQKALGAGNELTTGEIAGALLQRPSTYTPLAFGAVEGMMAPPEFDPSQDEGLAALESTYTPRDLRVTGGEFTQGDLSQEDYTRLALEGGLQSPLTPFRYEEEDTVTLAEGGTPEAKEVDTQVEEDTVASEEKRKEEEILQKRKAASEVDKFISNTVGGAALGALVQGGLNQNPAATATPYGQGAQPINTGGNFGFNQGGLVGLSNGGSTSTGSKKNSFNQRQELVFNFFKEKGYPDESIAAIMGNIAVEAPTFKYSEKEKGGKKGRDQGIGLFQFTKGRQDDYKKYLRDNKLSDNAINQLEYVHEQMTSDSKDELSYDVGVKNRERLRKVLLGKGMGAVEDRAKFISDIFLRPGKPHMERRMEESLNMYDMIPRQDKITGGLRSYFEGKVIGPGDGQSDQVLFDVEGNNPDMALLSPDEYVIPADAVAMIGSGSSNAGAKKLDGFVKNIRKKATGKTKQQKPIKQGLESFLA